MHIASLVTHSRCCMGAAAGLVQHSVCPCLLCACAAQGAWWWQEVVRRDYVLWRASLHVCPLGMQLRGFVLCVAAIVRHRVHPWLPLPVCGVPYASTRPDGLLVAGMHLSPLARLFRPFPEHDTTWCQATHQLQKTGIPAVAWHIDGCWPGRSTCTCSGCRWAACCTHHICQLGWCVQRGMLVLHQQGAVSALL
jgi:hypothetical protein